MPTFDSEQRMFAVEQEVAPGSGAVRERFRGPCAPFSILDTTADRWRAERSKWMELGIKSEVGRDGGLVIHDGNFDDPRYVSGPKGPKGGTGTSVFDAALTEAMYHWYCPAGGTILDPFAGGSVRGIVGGFNGYRYIGCELRPEQVAANEAQLHILEGAAGSAEWHQGDSAVTLPTLDVQADYVFTCPPYYDLEVYSDLPDDLSGAGTYDEFLAGYWEVLEAAVAKLKDDRFATVVVADFRQKKGPQQGRLVPFVADTIRIMEAAGAYYYQEAILVNAIGTLPLRINRQFAAGRKMGKRHQNVLTFCKGSWKAAAAAINDSLGGADE